MHTYLHTSAHTCINPPHQMLESRNEELDGVNPKQCHNSVYSSLKFYKNEISFENRGRSEQIEARRVDEDKDIDR